MEQRIVELEKRLAYLEKYVEDLNEVIIEQHKLIDGLTKNVTRLQARATPSPLETDRPHDEKPPHY